MRHGLAAHFNHLALCIRVMRERHRDHERACHFVQPGKDRPRQDAIILAHTPNQVGKDHPIHHAVRMVCNDHNRPILGDAGDLLFGGCQRNAHDIQRPTPESLTAIFGVTAFEFLHHA